MTGGVASAVACGALCTKNSKCLSFEYSTREKVCNRNSKADPTHGRHRDYIFCTKGRGASPRSPFCLSLSLSVSASLSFFKLLGCFWSQFNVGLFLVTCCLRTWAPRSYSLTSAAAAAGGVPRWFCKSGGCRRRHRGCG